ncbi:BamA/TamA family outer membrane protein [Flavisolibacter ginsenosidimutans]|uniref:translocation and assembly module lipoprotein TamL n=1 Tax=Flavisolibacter ginsenosidimutans TaxID=661481 RepID=UPI001D14B864|nr:BamA/TamA family outer membrane protein [Flavisolibacter ginsenosidimutans]
MRKQLAMPNEQYAMNNKQCTTNNRRRAPGKYALPISNCRLLIAHCTLLIFLAACSATKHIPEGDALYTGANVKLNAENTSKQEKKVLLEDLTGLTRPRPNGRFLGIPFKLLLWNFFYTTKTKGLKHNLQQRLGEPPVLASSVSLSANTTLLQNHLQNKGFFGATVSADSTWKKKKASVTYTANAGPQYHIASVTFSKDTTPLSAVIDTISKNTLLKVGAPYDLDLIKGERERIDALVKERGYYYFSPEYLLVQVDSTYAKDYKVGMRVVVKPTTPAQAQESYRINNVYVYSNYSLNSARRDTAHSEGQLYEGFHIIDPLGKFKPKLFTNVMTFHPGDVYNRTNHNKTLQRLMNLNVFKFVKNRFEKVATDTPKLNAYYYLTPYPEKALRAEIGAETRSNNMNGSEITLGFTHRNAFRAGEQMDLKVYAGTEAQFAGSFSGVSTFRLGGEINFAIPRFVVPFFHMKSKSAYVPRTNIQLGYEQLTRSGLYSLNSFHGGLGYLWKESPVKSHELYPIAITYAQPRNVNDSFQKLVDTNFVYRHIIDKQFILGSTYQLNINQQAAGFQKINSFYFNLLGDISGNLAGLVVPGKKLFNIPFAQYIKVEADGRYYRKLGLSNTWANRIILGYGLPYGNSRQLPYIKQYFSGGNNSLRGFRSRTVGPGSYLALPTSQGYIPDQTGDLKLELNTELRPKISGPLYGAVFVDAGNIWLANNDSTRPGATFGKDFLKQLAMDAGVGIRLDIQLFVIRLDLAFPIRKPWQTPGNRWVLNDVRFGDPTWRRDNLVFNLAIGYPF